MILRRERRDRFTIIDNTAVTDSRLSFKALGLLTYLLSRPDGWTANYRQLVATHLDGETSVRSGLAELRAAGYLEQRRVRDPGGVFGWVCVIRETPVDNPGSGGVDNPLPCGGFPGMGSARSNKDGEAKTVGVSSENAVTRATIMREAEKIRAETSRLGQTVINRTRAQRLADWANQQTATPPVRELALCLLGEGHGLRYWCADNPNLDESGSAVVESMP